MHFVFSSLFPTENVLLSGETADYMFAVFAIEGVFLTEFCMAFSVSSECGVHGRGLPGELHAHSVCYQPFS